ncbi:hypothetical protein B0H94_10280 [Salsuginibacillus halophilus]|uniref:Uncharacterized protein n=1 Tax=Salsuginibacillus halophilus TaxID=517424 RepID=A0A2P8HX90_9BACI|nr:hypothetical protein [Salsuginibacillus halophilus]PSL50804.1 hypothetical protein B0H94_10280 [Salsuginibacillus halophilus]
MQKIIVIFIAAVMVLAAVGFVVPVQLSAPPDARIVLDHTNETYVAPACFNDADVTNNLTETTYAEAKRVEYTPESVCTEHELTAQEVPLFMALLQWLGLVSHPWEES